MTKEFIIIIGPQGSGKSTQGIELAKFLGYQYISTGRLLRDLKNSGSPESAELENYWLHGKLVPDELINKLLFNYIQHHPSLGFVLDGYPRDIAQVEHFMNFLSQIEGNLKYAFYITVSEEECIKRLKLRRELEKREDETEDAMKTRLAEFHRRTEPVIQEFERMGRLVRIDGERAIDPIQDDLRSYFKIVDFVDPDDISKTPRSDS